MKLRGSFFSLVCFLLFAFVFVSGYEYSVDNISLKENYSFGEALSGKINLTLVDAPANLYISSELGETSLRDFLKNNEKELACEQYECASSYEVSDSGSTEKTFYANSIKKAYGLFLNEEDSYATSLDLNINAIFPEYSEVPLGITIGDTFNWELNEPANNYDDPRQINTGCFDSDASYIGKFVDSEGYCEQVNLESSKKYFLGASIFGSGVFDMVMFLKKDGSDISSCSFSGDFASYEDINGCEVSFGEPLEAGDYYVCVKSATALTNYNLKSEVSGTNCGYYKNSAVLIADYSLVVVTPKYSALDGMVDLGSDFSFSASEAINNYISSRYPSGCGSGCLIPISFYGLGDEISISDISLSYSSSTGAGVSSLIYEVEENTPLISLSGEFNIEGLNWATNSYGKQIVNAYLVGQEEEELFSENIFVKFLPVVKQVYPTNPPAGIDIPFYADILSNFSKIEWDFGDGSSKVTRFGNTASHIYTNISQSYNISLTVYSGNESIIKSFIVNTISPENYINQTFGSKRTAFNKVSSDVNNLPLLYRNFVKEKLKLDSIWEAITQIEILRASAISSEDFLNIANKINLLIMPASISLYESRSGSMGVSSSSIDPSIVSKIVPGNYSSFEEYKLPIASWQLKNFNSTLTRKKFRVTMDNGEKTDLITVYELNLKSKSLDTAYLVIQEPQANIHFSSGVNSVNIESKATSIEFSAGQEKTISFFVEGSKDLIIFISPALGVLPLQSEISVCRVNGVCQKENGENSENCRADCMPVFSTTLVILGVLIIMLIVYTILQFWYVIRYEKYLFKERAQIFNLLAFINNSKLNAKSSGEIISTLESQGWSHEQIEYAIKKSDGKNTGMFEILPVQKLVAYLEMKKAEKNKNERVAPPVVSGFVSKQFPNMPSRVQPTRSRGNNQFRDKKDSNKI